MTILEFMRDKLVSFPQIAEICNTIHVDFTDDSAENYGLSSTGDALLSEDVLGNQKRVHTFVLYAVYQSINDYDRMANSGLIYELQIWLERQAQQQQVNVIVDGAETTGNIDKITVANGMLFEIPNENHLDLVRYQLQISAQYSLNQ